LLHGGEYDIVVVGAGPAGSRFAAGTAGRKNVLLMEENFEVGKPVQCSGLVSPRVIEMSGLRSWFNVINSVKFTSPSGNEFSLSGSEPKGYVIDRSALDVHLAEKAARAGADMLLGASFTGAERDGDWLSVSFMHRGDAKKVRCRLLVGADGMSSAVSRTFKLARFREIVSCVQTDAFAGDLNAGDAVRLYFGNAIAPGFFAWVIPAGGFARIGLGTAGSQAPAAHYFELLLKKLNVKRTLNITAGPIPLGNSGRMVDDGVMLIGDSAGQVKPISGGGIFTGMAAADVASRVALESLDCNDTSSKFLGKYEREWKRGVGRELERAALVRRIFLEMDDRHLDSLFRTLEDSSLREVLSRGDIDFPTELSPLVLSKAPGLLRYSPQLIKALL
jgi:geranylgeranyl reductase family protein